MSRGWWLSLGVVAMLCGVAPAVQADAAVGAMQTAMVLVADDDEDDSDDGDEKQSFFSQYFPFAPARELTEAVDDIVVPTYLINIIPAGGFWGPLLFLDDRPEMTGDVALAYFVPAAIGLAWSLGWSVVGLVFWPCAFLSCLGALPYCWIAPTASLNAWDWAYKHPGQKKHRKSKKKGGSSEGSAPEKKSGGGEAYGY